MIKKLIFDVDKTLILGVSYDKQVENTLRKVGLYSIENKERFISSMIKYDFSHNRYTKEEYIAHIKEGLGINIDNRFFDIYLEEVSHAIPETTSRKLIGILNTLSKYYELTLLTNYFSIVQMNRLNNMGIGHFFTECYGERITKPNEEAFLDAIGNYNPEECIMIGDNLFVDIKGALVLGINVIFVNPEHLPTDNLDIPEINKVEDITLELIESIERKNTKTLKLH